VLRRPAQGATGATAPPQLSQWLFLQKIGARQVIDVGDENAIVVLAGSGGELQLEQS
jgi:hypothetical protein